MIGNSCHISCSYEILKCHKCSISHTCSINIKLNLNSTVCCFRNKLGTTCDTNSLTCCFIHKCSVKNILTTNSKILILNSINQSCLLIRRNFIKACTIFYKSGSNLRELNILSFVINILMPCTFNIITNKLLEYNKCISCILC